MERTMKKCLIFDADDTLWENNIYFERAIEEFLELILTIASDRERVLSVLNEVEKESIPLWGYGSRNFINSLGETFRRLYSEKDGAAYHSAIEQIGDRLLNHPMDVIPGVASTLETLRE